ncbi:MAG: TIGR00266 family protein [Myxococcales bacterium]|nr:TIGR00266 family protein [Myxococcales bacterium]
MTQESVLDALVALEHEQLARYCDSISVDGVIAQTVTLELGRNQNIWCSRGSLLAYSDGVNWQLKVPGGAGKAVSRMLAGEGVSLTYVTAERPGTQVVLSANQPGRLVTWDLRKGPIVCTSGSFVAALGDVNIDVTVARSAGAAFFGGAGLFMQRLSGEGIVIVHGAGDFIERQLKPGEKLLVSTGNLAVFSADVQYSVRYTGGCIKSLFGGEGLFMTEMTGPGWVMLQSLKKLPVPGQQGAGQM